MSLSLWDARRAASWCSVLSDPERQRPRLPSSMHSPESESGGSSLNVETAHALHLGKALVAMPWLQQIMLIEPRVRFT